MNKHLSVLALQARNSIFKIFKLFLVMACVEAGGFWYALRKDIWTEYGIMESELENSVWGFEIYLQKSHVAIVALAAVGVMTLLLYLGGTETHRCKTSYTYKRLRITEKQILFWQAIYNGFCYFMFWIVQVLIALGLWAIYRDYALEENVNLITNQTLYLATYRSGFLHGLLPLDDWLVWLRNIIMVIASGLVTARYAISQRSKIGVGGLVILLAFYSTFPIRLGEESISMLAGTFSLSIASMIPSFIKDWRDEL